MDQGVVLTKKTRATILATSYTASSTATATTATTATTDAFPAYTYEVGVDEAGRGPLFGRVYTGAVILPPASPAGAAAGAATAFDFSLLKDSKKFSSDKKIREVADYIKEHAVAWAVSYEEAEVIDRINIRRATLQCMRNSIKTAIERHVEKMEHTGKTVPTYTDYLLLVDGKIGRAHV